MMADLEDPRNGDISLLFVGDPNLGEQGFEIVRRYFADATCAIWQRGDQDGARQIRRLVWSRPWDLLVSFYNDLLFSGEDLTHAKIALNIHPASPCLCGVGYDELPLVLGHTTHGVTLHEMVAKPDAGRIIDVMEEPLPPDLPSSELRVRNQRLCLRMLEKHMLAIQGAGTVLEASRVLNGHAREVKAQWSADYFSRARVKAILDDLRIRQPDHRAFR